MIGTMRQVETNILKPIVLLFLSSNALRCYSHIDFAGYEPDL